MRPITSAELLHVCEQGAAQPVFQRALSLLVASCRDESYDALASLSIGERDGRLFKLRDWLFGSHILALAHCPACEERLEFSCDSGDLCAPAEHEVAIDRESELRIGDRCFTVRMPNSLDLISLGSSPAAGDASASRQFLLNRCVVGVNGQESTSAECLPANAVDAVVAQIAKSDPRADMQIALQCPACRHEWQTEFDIVSFFWSEICAWADRLLREVHSLAAAYGWSEAEILAMSCWRRQRYLELVHA